VARDGAGHPLDRFKAVIGMMSNTTSRSIKDAPNGERAVIGGLVTTVKTILDKNQRQMAFVTLEDSDGQTEVVLFSDVLEKSRRYVVEDSVVLVEGKVSKRNGGEGKVLVNTVVPVDGEQFPLSKEIHFTIDLNRVGEEKVDELKELLARHSGESKVFFHVKEGERRSCVIRSRSLGVKLDYDLVSTLSESIGAGNIRVIPTALGA
jgi:DNA polymerase-3 subunit alpha